ncbi:hypothetical protein GOODEAATRI_033463 [Goodea atripinnis]|uniref:Uncharacterized protein n=1 Tax=Goodea atripinnis TaxID=208336 RepID=A0ABV0MMS4_9TELE
MVTTESHQSQDLMVPAEIQDLSLNLEMEGEEQASPSSASAAFDPEKFSQGPVNAITVLTLLDKLVNMLDAVQDNQNKMEVSWSEWSHPARSRYKQSPVRNWLKLQQPENRNGTEPGLKDLTPGKKHLI